MKKQERVMLIDALNLFLRAYIVNPTIAKDGSPIGGTVGFLKSLQKLTRVCRYSQFKDYQKVIVSSDKDFYQLLDDTTVLHRPIQQKYLNCKNIVEEHGIHPNNFALARAMAGDKSDNLKGVPGVGLKTIAKRFPFFADEEDVTIKYLIEFCNHQESNIKAYAAISDDEQLVKDNYSLMQLYSPSLSIQTKQSIDWTIKEFQYMFNNTETNLMMYQDGINQINWSDMFREFKRLRMDNKKR